LLIVHFSTSNLIYHIFSFRQDLTRLATLRKHCQLAAEPWNQPFLQACATFHKVLQDANSEAAMGFGKSSTYLRPHLVRKLLVLHSVRTQEKRSPSTALSWTDFLNLGLPDQGRYVKSLPEHLQDVEALQEHFGCHPLYLSCFACLAGPVV
jgi:hypothetical protein